MPVLYKNQDVQKDHLVLSGNTAKKMHHGLTPNYGGATLELHITIYGEPVPQGRPKFARIGGRVHTYDPEKSRNYKQLVRFWVTEHLKKIYGFKPLENAVCVDLTFYMPVPVSWTRKKRIEAINGTIRPVSKKAGDIDNLFKCVTDSCNGLLWVDDCIITDIHARKRYTGDIARTEMIVCEVKPC